MGCCGAKDAPPQTTQKTEVQKSRAVPPPAAAPQQSEPPAPAADYPPKGLSAGVKNLSEWIQLGCGDAAYICKEKQAIFAPDGECPKEMPDLSNHSSFMAEVLVKQPQLWAKLKDRKTANGVTFAQCIKTGIDNPGHPMIKTVGMTAGDEESYTTFKELFDPVIDARHGGYGVDGKQPTNMDLSKLSKTDTDPYNKYVWTSRVRTGRSVKGFKLPPCISFEERRQLEALAVKALMKMEGDLKGDYYPLHGSRSYAPKPNGMDEKTEEKLRKVGNLFQEPDSTLLLASGMGRHWPDARGIFHNKEENLFVWLNEEDHLRIVSMQGTRGNPTKEGRDIKEVTARFIRACGEVEKVLTAEGSGFMHNSHLGWVLTCPSNLGTGLRAGCMVELKLLSKDHKDKDGRFKPLLKAMRLQMRGTAGVDSTEDTGVWDISNADRIGKGEVDLVNCLIEGMAKLTKWEDMLSKGQGEQANAEIDEVLGIKGLPDETVYEAMRNWQAWFNEHKFKDVANLYTKDADVTVNGEKQADVQLFLTQFNQTMGGTNFKVKVTEINNPPGTSKDTWTVDGGSGTCACTWAEVDGVWKISKDVITFAPKPKAAQKPPPVAPKDDADRALWDAVDPFWKSGDGDGFDLEKLQKYFPGEPGGDYPKMRRDLFNRWDENASGKMSLAEFDSAFNKYTIKCQSEGKGGKVDGGKSTLYKYVRPCLIRAFALANGIDKGGDKDYIGKREMRVLMAATQASMCIYRIFDKLDTSGDRRIEWQEWVQGIATANKDLQRLNPDADQVTAGEFSSIDEDGSGKIMLQEAVLYFLDRVCKDMVVTKDAGADGQSPLGQSGRSASRTSGLAASGRAGSTNSPLGQSGRAASGRTSGLAASGRAASTRSNK